MVIFTVWVITGNNSLAVDWLNVKCSFMFAHANAVLKDRVSLYVDIESSTRYDLYYLETSIPKIFL